MEEAKKMEGIVLACIVESVSTRKDMSVKLTLATQELSEGHAGKLFGLINRLAAIYISPKETIAQNEIDRVDEVNSEFEGKSQSQRMRNVLHKLFSQDAEGHTTFDQYYYAKTELIIKHLKNKIK